MSDSSTTTPNAPLALPPPDPTDQDAAKLPVGSALKFDALGPMVVNSDGTLSRIANWKDMTELERERTLRVLNARNKIRLGKEEEKLRQATEGFEASEVGA